MIGRRLLAWVQHAFARRRPSGPYACPLACERLEDRTVPSASASLLGFNLTYGNWQTASLSNGALQVNTVAHWDPDYLTGVVQGDFTGNGETDIAGWSAKGYWLVGVDNGGQFTTSEWYAGPGMYWRTFLVGDFTGDGKDDIAMLANSGVWYVAVSTGSSFVMQQWSQPGQWQTGAAWYSWQVGDFNGDGVDDIAGFTTQGVWQVGISTGSAFVPQVWLPANVWPAAAQIQAVVAGDFNGDGRTDVAACLTNGEWLVALSTGKSFKSSVWGQLYDPGAVGVLFHAGDFNGDGRADIVVVGHTGSVWLFTSSGSSFVASSTRINLSGQTLLSLNTGDFDGDGKDDLAILTHAGNWWIALGGGKNFDAPISGAFGSGNWIATFATSAREPDLLVNHHVILRQNSPLNYVTPQDMAVLRAQPSYFATIFQAYQFRLAAQLDPLFGPLDQQALAFSLATLVAYENAPYRGLNDPQGIFAAPRSLGVSALLTTAKLVCDEYCILAAELYRVAMPAAGDPNTTVTMVGFGAGPFGDHAQLFFENDGVSLLGDPTLGLVAQTSFASLSKAVPVPPGQISQLIYRVEASYSMQITMVNFRQDVYGALVGGLYPQETLIYTTDMTQG